MIAASTANVAVFNAVAHEIRASEVISPMEPQNVHTIDIRDAPFNGHASIMSVKWHW